jgi:putative nucleotidyltransferase with HDIG domain
MLKSNMPEYRISIDQLRPGVFIRLEKANWFDHPFLFNKFKIKDEEHIALLRELGIVTFFCIPEKSDVLPSQSGKKKVIPPRVERSKEVIDRLWEIKKERTRRLKKKKEQIALCEKKFNSAIREFNTILKGILSGNADSMDEAIAYVDKIGCYFLDDRESTLHLMNVVDQAEAAYCHPVNVAVLAMMVGGEAGLTADEMTILGLGALLHDIGKESIPKKILKKRPPLTKSEQELLNQHTVIGAQMLANVESFSPQVAKVIAQHHERADGSGFPDGLKSEQISKLAHIVAVADTYDNHTNSYDPNTSLTPYLALSFMFGQQKQLFDVEILALFIRCLGIYPPGTVVELSNSSIGMVMAVNPKNQLNPSVVLYDEEVPKKEALIIDLAEEPDIRVEKSIRLAHLSQEVLDYLSPRTKITYFVDPS